MDDWATGIATKSALSTFQEVDKAIAPGVFVMP